MESIDLSGLKLKDSVRLRLSDNYERKVSTLVDFRSAEGLTWSEAVKKAKLSNASIYNDFDNYERQVL